MLSRWQDEIASEYKDELSIRVYSSRLLGEDPSLVLHGGGNTSVKLTQNDIYGNPLDVIYVKGSGWDLATIEAPGYTPLRLQPLIELSQLDILSDTEMVNQLKINQLDASSPTASVEAILHAVLPYRYVDHTHADALISICNTPSGADRIREIYGDDVVVIPYIKPGFDLAKLVAELFPQQAHKGTLGMVLMNHGMFSFGEDAKESYERMIELIDRAERYLKQQDAWSLPADEVISCSSDHIRIAELRQQWAKAFGAPIVLNSTTDPAVMAFCQRHDLDVLTQQGPATPDHVIRTKQLPMIGTNLDTYVQSYHQYFERNSDDTLKPLDSAPRVMLDPNLGMITAGKTIKDARIVEDIYRHTIDIVQRADRLESWQALPEKDIFDVEYWELEQAKLNHSKSNPAFTGEIVLITGAASGIGCACVDSFLNRGAAVVAVDRNEAIHDLFNRPDVLSIDCDLTNESSLRNIIPKAIKTYGGLDMLVLNAGIFPGGMQIESMDKKIWHDVFAINLDANLLLMQAAHPVLRLSPNHGRVAVVGSKNIAAPGNGAAAYSSSKAALNQLVRIAALEWAGDGIRINSVHPDAVFDTGIWTDEVLLARAMHYGISIEEYKTRNLLKTEIMSKDVAELIAVLCEPAFDKTTGAHIPIDGGNERVI